MADELGNLVVVLDYEVDNRSLDKFGKSLEDTEKKQDSLSSRLRRGATRLAKFGAAAAAAAVAIATKLIVSLSELGDDVAKTSKQLGIGTDELQRLRFAAERSGTSTGALEKGIKKLNTGLVDAATKGTGPFIEGLGLLDLSLSQIEDLNAEEKIKFLADELNGVADPALRSAAAAKLFGERAGPEMLSLLEEGADGIEALGDRAEALGGVLGKDALKASEEFQDGLTDLKTAAIGAAVPILTSLAPSLTDMAEGTANWVAENQEFITQDLPEFLAMVVEGTADVVKWFLDAATQVDDFVTEIDHLIETIEEDYGPAIETATDIVGGMVDIWGDVTEGIAEAGLELLEFIGVIDDAEQALEDIKAAVAGEKVKDLIAGRGGRGQGAQTFLGGPNTENNIRNRDRIAREQDQKAAAEERRQREAEQKAALDADKKRAADARARDRAREDRRRRLGRGRRRGRRGGGGAPKGPDTEQANSIFGDRLRQLGGFAGATDKALQSALEATAKSLEEGASEEVAFAAGVGQIEKLTGTSLGDTSGGDVLSQSLNAAAGIGGGGESPTAGAKFVNIDQSFRSDNTININIQGGSARETAQEIENQIGEVLKERDRQAYDHFRPQTKV